MSKPTRKEMHAEGIRFLQQAMEAADQADSCFRDAKTTNCTGSVEKLTGNIQYQMEIAKGTPCYDCGCLIADCLCAWANQEVGS